jgi:hypothetical protein
MLERRYNQLFNEYLNEKTTRTIYETKIIKERVPINNINKKLLQKESEYPRTQEVPIRLYSSEKTIVKKVGIKFPEVKQKIKEGIKFGENKFPEIIRPKYKEIKYPERKYPEPKYPEKPAMKYPENRFP